MAFPGSRKAAPQVLLFDADDTLWENNIYFERAIASFISYLGHATHSPAEVREHLNRVELSTIAQHGYGLASFRRSLVTCFEDLVGCKADAECHRIIETFAGIVAEHEIELLEGVADTLAELASRHRLLLVTKGRETEQRDKLARSILHPHFSHVEVLAEKNEAAYRDLVGRYDLSESSAWMIGNSPRSDINPALAAGLNAVFLPHRDTWVLEQEKLRSPAADRELLELASFRQLLEYF